MREVKKKEMKEAILILISNCKLSLKSYSFFRLQQIIFLKLEIFEKLYCELFQLVFKNNPPPPNELLTNTQKDLNLTLKVS